MGFSIAWISVKGQPKEFVLEQMGLRPTGNFDETFNGPTDGVPLPGGWYTVIGQGCDYAFKQMQAIRRISQVADIVIVGVEEHVMSAYAEYWSNGKQMWWLCHNASDGPNHLDTSGQLPPEFTAVRSELEEKQQSEGDADYIFDIPVELAKRITGFRHDEDLPELGARPYEELSPIGQAKRWWQFWK